MNIKELKLLADTVSANKIAEAKRIGDTQIKKVKEKAAAAAGIGDRFIDYKYELNKHAIDSLREEGFTVSDLAEAGYHYRISGW